MGGKKVEIVLEHSMRFIISPLLDSLVTCVGHDGKPNIIEISLFSKSWGLPLKESDPPFGVYQIMVHPNRYSHKLIEESGEFVINIPTADMAEQRLFCGTRSGRKYDKFKETKLTPVPAKHVKAPLIQECPINIECKVVEVMKPKYSAYTFFFGKALAIHVEEGIWDGNIVDLDKISMALPVPHKRQLDCEYRLLGKVIFRGGKRVEG